MADGSPVVGLKGAGRVKKLGIERVTEMSQSTGGEDRGQTTPQQ